MQDVDQLCGISAAGRRIRKEGSNDSRRSRRELWAARPGPSQDRLTTVPGGDRSDSRERAGLGVLPFCSWVTCGGSSFKCSESLVCI